MSGANPDPHFNLNYHCSGNVSEWFKEPVLKTGDSYKEPWVRIPPLPLPEKSGVRSWQYPLCVDQRNCLPYLFVVYYGKSNNYIDGGLTKGELKF